MYTIDEFIERLCHIREIATLGGQTPVAIGVLCSDELFEQAEVELQPVNECAIKREGTVRWRTDEDGNTLQIAKVW